MHLISTGGYAMHLSTRPFVYYFNHERIHQSLDYQTPDEVFKQGTFPDINLEEVA